MALDHEADPLALAAEGSCAFVNKESRGRTGSFLGAGGEELAGRNQSHPEHCPHSSGWRILHRNNEWLLLLLNTNLRVLRELYANPGARSTVVRCRKRSKFCTQGCHVLALGSWALAA